MKYRTQHTQQNDYRRFGLLFFSLLLALGLALPAYANLYEIDTQQSTLEWVGKKVTGQHNGVVSVKKGIINLEGKQITGGEFEIDMTSITVSDIEDPEKNAKLVGHLKSEDFFSVEKHPIAKFMITQVEEKSPERVEITGNLNIKGITRAVRFPATVTYQGDTTLAKGELKLDRSKWDIRYGSGKFFKGLGDKLIDDEIELKLDLVAKKSVPADKQAAR